MKRIAIACGLALASIAGTALSQTGEVLRTTFSTNGDRVLVRDSLPPPVPCRGCTVVQPRPPIAPPKISADLMQRLPTLHDEDAVEVVVSFPEDVTVPPFPMLREDLPDAAPENVSIRNRRAMIADGILATRRQNNRGREEALNTAGMKIRDRFWLSNSLLAAATPRAIRAAAALDDVVHIELNQTDIAPPTTAQGRSDTRSDTIFNMAWYTLTYWRTAMLDTGMPMLNDGTKLHVLFSGLSNMAGYDCVNTTDTSCTVAGQGLTINIRDDCWNHATHTASILVGTGSMGDDYRGVTAFPYIYGYKVYDCVGLNTAAAQRGFQAAVIAGAKVIVAEIQAFQGSALSASANAAYDSGTTVIAAAGNYSGENNGVRSPGEAKEVIAVGAVDAWSLAQQTYQSHGPEPDGRVKPEIQGPTNTVNASATGCTDSTCQSLGSFTGTSGSTPFAGGAATLLGWWFNPNGTWVYPGYIYVSLINLSNNYTNPTTDNTRGSGLLRLWSASGLGPGATGYQYLSQSTQYEYPLNPGTSDNFYDLTASVWWPESATQAHNEVDLALVDPSGVVRASCSSTTSVFQKARVAGLLAQGTWKVRITRQGGGSFGLQQVFFTVYMKQGTQWPD